MPVKIGFDYSSVSARDKQAIFGHVKAIRSHLRQSAQATVEIGRRLKLVQGLIPGQFKAWLRAEFPWTIAVAWSYMAIAERFGDLDCLHNFDKSALILLLPENVPQQAIDRAIELARNGQLVTKTLVNELREQVLEDQSSVRSDAEDETASGRPRKKNYGVARSIKNLTETLKKLRANMGNIFQSMTDSERAALAEELVALAEQLRTAVNDELEAIDAQPESDIGDESDFYESSEVDHHELATV